jgi:hypothetical protein
MNQNLKSSSLAETAYALALIAICFSVASIIFLRTSSSTTRIQDIKNQTMIQSILYEALVKDTIPLIEGTDLNMTEEISDGNGQRLKILSYSLKNGERIIWQQEFYKTDSND